MISDDLKVSPGTVYWITGLSGAGKTTIGTMLYRQLRQMGMFAVHLDGDELRDVFGGKHGYSEDVRMELAMHYSRLCLMLSKQGVNVVCSTISMYHKVQKWNRSSIKNYRQVYLKVPMSVLVKRDQKGIYSEYYNGGDGEISGLDLDVSEPWESDIIVENDGSRTIDSIYSEVIKTVLKG